MKISFTDLIFNGEVDKVAQVLKNEPELDLSGVLDELTVTPLN